jgi:hypothetical protein
MLPNQELACAGRGRILSNVDGISCKVSATFQNRVRGVLSPERRDEALRNLSSVPA